jgi:hypothetical protein
LTVNNVQDITSNDLTIAPGTMAQFVSTGPPAPVNAQINVQINADEFNVYYDAGAGSPSPLPIMTGAAVIGSPGDLWNQINSSNLTYTSPPGGAATVGQVPLEYVNGTASGISLTLSSAGSTYNANSTDWGNYSPFTKAGSPYSALMQSMLSDYAGSSQASVTLTGLAPGQIYNLYVYTAGDTNVAGGRTGTFSVGSAQLNYTWNGTASTLIQGVDYLEFSGTIGTGGTLAIDFGNSKAESDLNGFQLQLVAVPVQPAISVTAAGAIITLSFPTQMGFSYQVQYENGLSPGAWSPLGSSISGNNSVQSASDTLGANARFYRLVVQ